MTDKSQSLQERLRQRAVTWHYSNADADLDYEAASALDAKDALLAEAERALGTVQKENERARREFTNVSNNVISGAIDTAITNIRAMKDK